jgi:hypothetical protein
MGYLFIRTLERDRAIAPGELAFIEEVADRDRVVDEDERTMVSRIFRRIQRDMVAPEVWNDIERFKRRVGV